MISRESVSKKYTHSQIAFTLFDFKGFLVPLIVVLLKKNEDFFRCFSKLDDLAHTSIFQKYIPQLEEYGRESTFLTFKSKPKTISYNSKSDATEDQDHSNSDRLYSHLIDSQVNKNLPKFK